MQMHPGAVVHIHTKLTLSSAGQNASCVQLANMVLPRDDDPSLTFRIFPYNETENKDVA